jgi:hypothetical protein
MKSYHQAAHGGTMYSMDWIGGHRVCPTSFG